MKTKVIGFLIGIMLITALGVIAQPPQLTSTKKLPLKPTIVAHAVNVPIWNEGDQWTYQIDNVTILINQTDLKSFLYLTVDELPLTVKDVGETSYTLEVDTTVKGNTRIDTDLGNGPVNVSITSNNLKLSGTILINKSTLNIEGFSFTLGGRFWVDFIQQQAIPFSLPVIPVKVTMDLATDFSSPIGLLSFPLNTTMAWNSSASTLTVDGKVRSPWLYVIFLINAIAKLLGNELLPSEMAALLPIIDIKEALTTLGTGNVFQVPMIPYAFYCLNTELVNVPAGTYNAFNISILNGTARCYYAPDAKNVVKLTGDLQKFIPSIANINMELTSAELS